MSFSLRNFLTDRTEHEGVCFSRSSMKLKIGTSNPELKSKVLPSVKLWSNEEFGSC